MRYWQELRQGRILISSKIRARTRKRCVSRSPTPNDGIKRSVFPYPDFEKRPYPAWELLKVPITSENVRTFRLLTDPRHVAIRRWDFRDIKSRYKVGNLFISLLFLYPAFSERICNYPRYNRRIKITGRSTAAFLARLLKVLTARQSARRRARDESIGAIFAWTQLSSLLCLILRLERDELAANARSKKQQQSMEIRATSYCDEFPRVAVSRCEGACSWHVITGNEAIQGPRIAPRYQGNLKCIPRKQERGDFAKIQAPQLRSRNAIKKSLLVLISNRITMFHHCGHRRESPIRSKKDAALWNINFHAFSSVAFLKSLNFLQTWNPW